MLRQACHIFRRDLNEIGNIEVFLEAITIPSACNKVLRKNFLKPDTTGLIPAGGFSCNQNYSKKALMWLLHMEQTDGGCRILHARNCREYRLPELPFYSADGYCVKTRNVFEFLGCFYTFAHVDRSGIFPHSLGILWQSGKNAQRQNRTDSARRVCLDPMGI
jgi:hypothetical protein